MALYNKMLVLIKYVPVGTNTIRPVVGLTPLAGLTASIAA